MIEREAREADRAARQRGANKSAAARPAPVGAPVAPAARPPEAGEPAAAGSAAPASKPPSPSERRRQRGWHTHPQRPPMTDVGCRSPRTSRSCAGASSVRCSRSRVGFAAAYCVRRAALRLPHPAAVACWRPDRSQLIGTGVTEAFFTKLKVSFIAAIFLASPVIFYQAWRFVAPGLYEQREAPSRARSSFAATVFFVVGAVVLLLRRLPGRLPVLPRGVRHHRRRAADPDQRVPVVHRRACCSPSASPSSCRW